MPPANTEIYIEGRGLESIRCCPGHISQALNPGEIVTGYECSWETCRDQTHSYVDMHIQFAANSRWIEPSHMGGRRLLG